MTKPTNQFKKCEGYVLLDKINGTKRLFMTDLQETSSPPPPGWVSGVTCETTKKGRRPVSGDYGVLLSKAAETVRHLEIDITSLLLGLMRY